MNAADLPEDIKRTLKQFAYELAHSLIFDLSKFGFFSSPLTSD
jgi:hypothetical protein